MFLAKKIVFENIPSHSIQKYIKTKQWQNNLFLFQIYLLPHLKCFKKVNKKIFGSDNVNIHHNIVVEIANSELPIFASNIKIQLSS